MSSEERNQLLKYKKYGFPLEGTLLLILFDNLEGEYEGFKCYQYWPRTIIQKEGFRMENTSIYNPTILIEAHVRYKTLVDKILDLIKKAKIGEIVSYKYLNSHISAEIFGYDQSPVLWLKLYYYLSGITRGHHKSVAAVSHH